MSLPRIFAIGPFPAEVEERAVREYAAVITRTPALTVLEMLEGVCRNRVEAIMFSSHTKFNAQTISDLPDHVKILSTCSVGYDHIDIAAARRRGLIVTNTPGVLTDATADMALMLLLCACRRAAEYLAIMHSGWRRSFAFDEMLGTNFSGRTLGIFGFGRIGQAVATRARAFNVRVVYHSTRRVSAELEKGALYCSSFEEMLPYCEMLSLHAPGGEATAGILGRKAISLLPRGAVIVNTARGTLIDEHALIDGLKSGQVGAAGLDVFLNEPGYDLRLRDMPNVFITPHMGSATIETRTAMGMRALDNIAAVLASAAPPFPVFG